MLISPLRYPGSKSAFYKVFCDIFLNIGLEGRHIIEPYAGSASISLNLLNDHLVRTVTLYERDPLLFSFWSCVFEETEKFVERLEDLDVSLIQWHKFRTLLAIDKPTDRQRMSLALACILFNRANFSGVLHAGPIGGMSQGSEYSIDCRFNREEIVRRIRQVAKLGDNVSIVFGDALQKLKRSSKLKNTNRIFYVDPPYFQQGKKLYRYHYSLQQHLQLADVLKRANFDWILSYDKHHVIEFLYESFTRLDHKFQYSAKTPKKATELLITNISEMTIRKKKTKKRMAIRG